MKAGLTTVTENLLFSFGRVSPYFLLILIGVLLVKKGGIPRDFFAAANRFVFRVALPVDIFCSVADPNNPMLDFGFMAYGFLFALGSFFVLWGVTEIVFRKNKAIIGTLVQGAYRSNMVLIGAPIVIAVVGDAYVQLAIAGVMGAIPVYNVCSVLVLAARGTSRQKVRWLGVLKDVVTNPLLIGLALGLPFMLLRLQIPDFAFRTLDYIGGIAVPLGLISIGGLFNMKDATARLGPALYATMIKIGVLPVMVVLVSYLAGYRGTELLVLFLLFTTPNAFSSYAFASSMGGDAHLASNIVILSTLLSAFSIAIGIFALGALGL